MKGLRELQDEYVVLAASWGEAIRVGNDHIANQPAGITKNDIKYIEDHYLK